MGNGRSGGNRTPTAKGHWILNPARLPVPPRSLIIQVRLHTLHTRGATGFSTGGLG